MKINSSTITWLIMGFFWSLFMGVTAIAIGFGAAYPPLNQVAAPFVCPNGQMTYTEAVSNPLPGTTYTQIGWYCVDKQTGASTELGIFPMTIYSGIFYGLLLYVVVFIIWYFSSRRKASLQLAGDGLTSSVNRARPSYRFSSGSDEDNTNALERTVDAQDALSRMKELKKLRDASLISETEYQQKRVEILKDV